MWPRDEARGSPRSPIGARRRYARHHAAAGLRAPGRAQSGRRALRHRVREEDPDQRQGARRRARRHPLDATLFAVVASVYEGAEDDPPVMGVLMAIRETVTAWSHAES